MPLQLYKAANINMDGDDDVGKWKPYSGVYIAI